MLAQRKTENSVVTLADFRDLTLQTLVPATLYFVVKFHADSLELTMKLPFLGLYTKDGACGAALNLSEDGGRSYVVVYDHRGKPVSIYHRGELVV